MVRSGGLEWELEIQRFFKDRRNNTLIHGEEGETASIGDRRENYRSVPLCSREGTGSSYRCRAWDSGEESQRGRPGQKIPFYRKIKVSSLIFKITNAFIQFS